MIKVQVLMSLVGHHSIKSKESMHYLIFLIKIITTQYINYESKESKLVELIYSLQKLH